MRLNSIKMSGFKSFADPTNFLLPGQLVGVVGPNGCGKSNIIDAVRWVLGESRASELRGESMQDVIFNGTNTRKSSSRASVELVFDNQSHRAGGQWNQFEEIAVKRVLTRDGNSSYYINNQPVRRRDVQDVFLGTGLGPRAYAIIGQGTISRIIESKPEELRLFLEEAAGVSKYKERRRETENRLSDTRENLTRVEDILRELTSNLEKLERQAEVAQQYQELQKKVTLRQQQLWWLKRNDAQAEQTSVQQQSELATNALEAKTAELRQTESEVETLRQSHYEAGEQVNQAQGQLYQASAEVGRLEAEIRFVLEGRQRAQARLAQMQTQTEQWQQNSVQAQHDIEQCTQDMAALQAQLTQSLATLESQQAQLPALEGQADQARQAQQAQLAQVTHIQQQIKVLAAEQSGLHEQWQQLEQRTARLEADRRSLEAPDDQRLSNMQQQLDQALQQAKAAQTQLDTLEVAFETAETTRKSAQQAANEETAKLVALQASQQALKDLQEKLRSDERLKPWLNKHGLERMQPLWTKIQITPGWEQALEAALRERLAALEVSNMEGVKAFASDAPAAKLSFYSPAVPSAPSPAQPLLPRLFDQLKLGDAALNALMADWLTGCFTAKDLTEALTLRSKLQPGQQLFTPQGHAVGLQSVSFYAQDSEQSGLLARAQEIDNLDKQIRAQSLIAQEASAHLTRSEAQVTQTSQQRTQVRQEATQAQANAHRLDLAFTQAKQQAEQVKSRQGQLSQELDELHAQRDALRTRREAQESQFEQWDMQLAQAQERHESLLEATQTAHANFEQAKEASQQTERQRQELLFNQRTLEAKQSERQRGLDTAQQQITQLATEIQRQEAELASLSDTAAQAGLQDALALKLERESILAAKRSTYDDLTQRLKVHHEKRLTVERELEPLRQKIVEWQLKGQAARLGFEQYEQLLLEAQADLQAIESSIQEEKIKLNGLQSEIDKYQREIASLGAVNLAALDELGTARERKTFLDAQSADLNEAIQTLEDAIRKIDAETRDLLAETFNTVNRHFGVMFPELFGGGNAKLVMTGDEILDSGVQVMAQPPGKKNQTIHLLSGGEKALTAIALVFAIFQLNPAPFCLLDEVDAPLDDANTERYRKLVTSMAKETQFLFISHNKIAMEMAEQLIGVTMQEQGVSRIVAVDMEAAVTMAETE